MDNEIIKIIEGGLTNDREKVFNYAIMLANSLELNGNVSLATRIRSALKKAKSRAAEMPMNSFSAKFTDLSSKMEALDVSAPSVEMSEIVLNDDAYASVIDFINSYKKRELLLESELSVANSLLLFGPPGCGKTTVAQFISCSLGLPLVTAKLGGLVSSVPGSTGENICKVFNYVSKKECVLFLDEFDDLAKLKFDKNGPGELKRAVSTICQNADFFSHDSILIAAANHEKLLDPKIWRRFCFSNIIALNKPEKEEIEKLLRITLKDRKTNFLENETKCSNIIDAFYGLSHSDIKTVLLNSLKRMVLSEQDVLNDLEVLKNIYLHKKRGNKDDNELVLFLNSHGVVQKEISEKFGIPLRKVKSALKQSAVKNG